MHILFLPSWYPQSASDVVGVFFRQQALAIAGLGHRVGVVAPRLLSLRKFSGIPRSASPGFEIDAGVPTYRRDVIAALPLVPYGNFWLFKRAAVRLMYQYITRFGLPDIIHAHCAVYAGAVAAALSNRFGVPMVVTEHSSGYARGLYAPWQTKLAGRAFDAARACIAVSPSLANTLSSQFPGTDGRWKWIPNMVGNEFVIARPRDAVRKRIRFLNVALMTENKGHGELLDAFRLAILSGLDAELALVGDGPLRKQLERHAVSIGIGAHVKFVGRVPPDAVPSLLWAADVLVVSSHYETFSVVVVEALMSGMPVIATRCGGPESIVAPGDGILVAPKEPREMAAAMIRMAADMPYYESSAIARRARSRFSNAAVATQISDVYEGVVAEWLTRGFRH